MADLTLAKKLFEIVRDIPYNIPLNLTDPDTTCHGKGRLLYELLSSYGFEVRLRVCSFYWSKLPILADLKKLIEQDLEYHSYVELKTDNNWIILDSSFDSRLKSKFPVNKWRTKGTKLSVIPEKITDIAETNYTLAKERSPEKIQTNIKLNYKLYKRLNKIYEETRK